MKELQIRGRLPGIQLGRAVAAASVFYWHAPMTLTYFDKSALRQWDWWWRYGASGVDLFFAISGFIVCYVAAGPSFTPANFLAKRFFRIYPANALATLLLVGLFASGIHIANDVSWEHVVRSILIIPQHNPVNSVGWTLEFEIAFYLVSAALLPLGGPLLLLAYCLAAFAAGLWLDPQISLVARFINEHYGDFAAGVAGYIALSMLPPVPPSWRWPVSVALVAAGLGLFELGHHIPTGYLTPVACGVAVVGLALLPWAPRFVVALGDMSYGFYLYHYALLGFATWLAYHLAPNKSFGELWRWEVFAHVWLLAWLSWILIEQPILRWANPRINRWFRKTVTAPERNQPIASSSVQACPATSVP